MKISVRDLASLVGGEVIGNPDVMITQPGKIESAGAGDITFLGNNKYEPYLYTSKASAILIDNNIEVIKEVEPSLIRVDNVYGALGKLLNYFSKDFGPEPGLSSLAFIHESVSINESARVGPFSVISEGVKIGRDCIIYEQVYVGKNVVIGDGTILYPGVRVYHDCVIGERCIVHSNSVVGSDGFGFSRDPEGRFTKIPQIGNVKIKDDVEIGANTVIDRATMGSTIIEEGVKLDNLIQIAHNVEIDKNTAIAAQAGISGSTKIGKNCMIGGQVGFVGHLTIADNTLVQAQSGVASNISEPNRKLYGYPAIEYQKYLRAYAYFKRLPEIVQSIREMEQKLDKIENGNK
ncbi:MAG: UDP-3-O-(3-hydroxymyristoyl)glucosamine N-acyltransferase [Saprospiraceae bacterium]|nr:UDP-3-O-(3-hydroxymyristoyl)glucosamine N-acyltransferase [Saprospiraceae bacterium]